MLAYKMLLVEAYAKFDTNTLKRGGSVGEK